VNPLALYLVLLKATLTTFSGLASIPVLRTDLVLHRHVLTDQQLNIAVVVTRATPGPAGLYIVSVGYFVAGIPGAIAAWAAMATPALVILPLIHYAGRRAEHPRVQGAIQSVVLASAGLLWATAVPLARQAVTDAMTGVIVLLSTAILLTRRVDSLWVVLGAALAYLAAASAHLVSGL